MSAITASVPRLIHNLPGYNKNNKINKRHLSWKVTSRFTKEVIDYSPIVLNFICIIFFLPRYNNNDGFKNTKFKDLHSKGMQKMILGKKIMTTVWRDDLGG